jgi:hypothetical protein
MTILYSNGCSFTANHAVLRRQRYPSLVGKHFGWQVIDRAIPGSCNSKIIRCAMRDCIGLLAHGEPIVALIQLTFKERFEYSGTCTADNSWKYGEINTGINFVAASDQFESLKPADPDNWPNEATQYAKIYTALQKPDAVVADLFSRLVGLVSFFQSNNIRYVIYAGPEDFKIDLNSNDPFYQYLTTDKNVLDFMQFNMLALTGQQSHPDVNGMKMIADYFVNLLGEPR